MPARGERLLERALTALGRALDASGAPWMVIGGIAVVARGVRRFTSDIDAAVRGDATSAAELVNAFARQRIAPRIPDAIRFAEKNLVLLLRHAPTGVDLDVSLAWSAFELDALAGREMTTFGRARVPMARARDLIIFKSVAGRPRDLDDVEALLALHPRLRLDPIRATLVELAALAEAPELVDAFDRAARRARPRRQGPSLG